MPAWTTLGKHLFIATLSVARKRKPLPRLLLRQKTCQGGRLQKAERPGRSDFTPQAVTEPDRTLMKELFPRGICKTLIFVEVRVHRFRSAW